MAKRDRTLPRIAGTVRAAKSAVVAPPFVSAPVRTSATIAIYSVKGGVGKTTISANLAWCSAELSGRPTLLWDLDAAGGSGFLYGLDPNASAQAGEVFARDADPSGIL